MALSSEVVSSFKEKLEKEKERLEKDLAQFANRTGTPGDFESRHDEIGREEEENTTEVEEYVDSLALENSLEKELKDVSDALQRMAEGKYGQCSVCGKDIEIERLEAYPGARTCIAHK